MWSAGQIRELGALAGARLSRARAINARGEVVGDCGDGHDGRAFLWTRARGMQDLNGLIASSSPFLLQEAVSINDQGQIVALGIEGGRGHHDHNRHGRAVPVRVFLLVPGR
jgi:probable HAF family extracellular repeat protein